MADNGMDYEPNGDHFEDDGPRYDRDQRSASPRRGDDGHDNARRRSASPSGNGDRVAKEENGSTNDDGAVNPGSNLFVTGIHPRLTESEVTRLFEKYGEVEKCQIMRDPHTKESRGFGFVKMVTSDQADAAKEGLQGEMVEGRTFSIEKARRARPRTPTPGKYFGPPKREGRGGGRFDDRRPGGYGGGGGGGGRGGYGRDDPYRYRGGYDRGGYDRRDYDRGYDRGYREPRDYDRSYRGEDRGYDRGNSSGGGGGGGGGGSGGYDRRDDGYGRIDRYAGGRDERGDRFGGREDRRGGGGGGGFDRDRDYRGDRGDRDGPRSREAPAASAGYGDSGSRGGEGRDQYGGGSRD